MEGEDRCCGDHDAAEEPLLEYRPQSDAGGGCRQRSPSRASSWATTFAESGWSHAVGIGCLCAASAFVFVATIEDD